VIDDFHRLEESVKKRLADLLKVTADAEDPSRKLVMIGINDAGKSLIEYWLRWAPPLVRVSPTVQMRDSYRSAPPPAWLSPT
jgi:hypothetical protein